MGSPVINILIKSDRIHKKTPRAGQIVRIEGRRGLFVVVRADQDNRVAEVMGRSGLHRVEENVPFASLRAISDNISEALNQFLESALGPAERHAHG